MNALSRWETWAGLGWNMVYLFAAIAVIAVCWGIMSQILDFLKYVVTYGGFGSSVAMMAVGFWPAQALAYMPISVNASVFIGAILFGASVIGLLILHNVEEGSPYTLPTLFMVVWGAVAAYYGNQWVGAMAVGALMYLAGFKIGVGRLCYAFGFNSKDELAHGTIVGTLLTIAYVGLTYASGSAPKWMHVYGPGVFYIATFVAYTGMLILSFGRFREEGINALFQVHMVVLVAAGVTAGMFLGVQALATIAGVFGFLFFLSKLAEIETDSAIGIGLQCATISAVLGGTLYMLDQHKINLIERMAAFPS